jgi:hypothetical protein
VGIPASWNLDTIEGLESRLSIRIHRILAELLHLTELELEKLRRIRTQELLCSSYSKDSRQARKSYSPQKLTSLSLYSTKNELRSTIGS